jgi:hypothetical protein
MLLLPVLSGRWIAFPTARLVFGDRNFDTAVVRRGTGAADAALPTVRETRVFSLLLEAAHVSAREE